MAQQSRFSLVEVVLVVVVLGILAVTALPRFMEPEANAARAPIENQAK